MDPEMKDEGKEAKKHAPTTNSQRFLSAILPDPAHLHYKYHYIHYIHYTQQQCFNARRCLLSLESLLPFPHQCPRDRETLKPSKMLTDQHFCFAGRSAATILLLEPSLRPTEFSTSLPSAPHLSASAGSTKFLDMSPSKQADAPIENMLKPGLSGTFWVKDKKAHPS